MWASQCAHVTEKGRQTVKHVDLLTDCFMDMYIVLYLLILSIVNNVE